MPRPPAPLLTSLAALALSATVVAAQGAGQATGQGAGLRTGEAKTADALIGCSSLANLRSLLRTTGEDRAAALAAIRDPKSDLGCSLLNRAAVTEIADHVSLNGRAYECLTLKGQAVCHWTVAGSLTLPERPAAKPPRGK